MIFTPLKLLSALIIVGACFFAGASVAEAEKTSYRQLSGILALLAHIRTRITYTHFSLEVIFADFYDDALEKCGFLACLKDARGGYSASFCEAVGRLTVTGETRDALLAFGRTLGGVSMREQYAALENTEAFLQEKVARLRESAEKKRRSYRSLGALAGAMIAVILF